MLLPLIYVCLKNVMPMYLNSRQRNLQIGHFKQLQVPRISLNGSVSLNVYTAILSQLFEQRLYDDVKYEQVLQIPTLQSEIDYI